MAQAAGFIVVTGKHAAKLTYIGPFADYDSANDFVEENRPNITAPMWIAEVVAPGLWWEEA